jgi:hypothetical protein
MHRPQGRLASRWLLEYRFAALYKVKSRTALQRAQNNLVLLIIIDSELRTTVWVCHERHFLADVLSRVRKALPTELSVTYPTAFVAKQVIDHHTRDRIVSLSLLAMMTAHLPHSRC